MAGSVKLLTPAGGSVTINAGDTASALSITLPATTDTITTNTATQILSNKTLNTPTISSSSGEIARVHGGTSSAGFVRFANDSNTDIGYIGRNNTSDIYLWQSTANSIRFGTNNLECGKFDSSGRFTIPNQPVFAISSNAAFAGPGMVPFATTRVNVGGYFNTTTYRFTAPVAGRYYLHYHNNHDIGNSGGAAALYADFYKNGSFIGYGRMYTNFSGGWEELSGSIIADLSVNDYIQVYLASSHRADSGIYSMFCGYLIG